MTTLLRRQLLALMLGVTTATLIMPLTFDAAAYADDQGSDHSDSGSDNDSGSNDDGGSDDNGSDDNGTDDNGMDDDGVNDDNSASAPTSDDGCKSDPLTCKLRALTK